MCHKENIANSLRVIIPHISSYTYCLPYRHSQRLELYANRRVHNIHYKKTPHFLDTLFSKFRIIARVQNRVTHEISPTRASGLSRQPVIRSLFDFVFGVVRTGGP